MLKLDQIQKLHIELTTKCNARCPMCPRNYRGFEFNSGYPDAELSLAQFKKICSADFLKQIKFVNFNGNLGDCGVCHDLNEIVEYVLDSSHALIGIQTNGGARTPQWWAKLASPRVLVNFGIDGLEDTHSLYRQDTNWQKVIDNAQGLITAGGRAAWKMIVFDHNRHQIDQCRDLALQLGFEKFRLVDDGRDQGPVYSRTGKFSHWLGPIHEQIPDVKQDLHEHLTWFDTKPSSEWGILEPAGIDCLHIKTKELYIAADGSVYPCCFLGFYPGRMQHPGMSQVAGLVKKNNALEYDLAECLEWFSAVEQSWRLPSIDQGRLYSCVMSCGSRP